MSLSLGISRISRASSLLLNCLELVPISKQKPSNALCIIITPAIIELLAQLLSFLNCII